MWSTVARSRPVLKVGPAPTRGCNLSPHQLCSYSDPFLPSGGSLLPPPSRTSIPTDQGFHMSVGRGVNALQDLSTVVVAESCQPLEPLLSLSA